LVVSFVANLSYFNSIGKKEAIPVTVVGAKMWSAGGPKGECGSPCSAGSDGDLRNLDSAGSSGDLGDLGELYAALAPRLERIVGMDVRAPGTVIEDACQLAWGRLVHHRHRVRRDGALSWLATTAIHEAFGVLRRQRKCDSLEGTLETYGDAAMLGFAPGADEQWELRERLERIATLPERQQQMLWLHGLGYNYVEIAASTGCTVRTVERQLLRAKRKMRSLADE
jgi:RNA polymerase sigma factor (sigma-70 family)